MFHRLDHLPPQRGLDSSFYSYTTLDGLPHRSYALYLLRRCAYIVGPIMRRHGWTVPMLHELSQYSSCHGKSLTQKQYGIDRYGKTTTEIIPLNIQLRLRDDRDPRRFVHMNDLVRTMLHELAHFAHARHFVGFYKLNAALLNELVKDVETGELRRRVDWRDVPIRIARLEEIVYTMTRDLKTTFAEMIGVERKDRYRYRV